MKLNHLVNFGTTIMVACALVVTGLLIRRELAPAGTVKGARAVDDWRRYAAEGHRRGPAAPVVTITEFSDFECPACRAATRELAALRARYPTQLAVVYRHMPLRIHRFAMPAARASECAARQGRFEAMHDTIFAWQDSLGLVPWTAFAASSGVPDTAAFSACTHEQTDVASITRDTAAAHALAITATPTLLINARLVPGVPPLRVLDAEISQLLSARAP